jgi:hypothetical protein
MNMRTAVFGGFSKSALVAGLAFDGHSVAGAGDTLGDTLAGARLSREVRGLN